MRKYMWQQVPGAGPELALWVYLFTSSTLGGGSWSQFTSLHRATAGFFPRSYICASSPPPCSDPCLHSHHDMLCFLLMPIGYTLDTTISSHQSSLNQILAFSLQEAHCPKINSERRAFYKRCVCWVVSINLDLGLELFWPNGRQDLRSGYFSSPIKKG